MPYLQGINIRNQRRHLQADPEASSNLNPTSIRCTPDTPSE
jgi:hypothetical protein